MARALSEARVKLIGLILSTLLVLIQYPLWLGSGSWFRVWEMDRHVAEQHARNGGMRLRNEGLEAEVQDLHRGRLAIEERARYGLGMIRQDEIFVQLGPLPTGGDVQPRPSAQRTGPLASQRGERNVLPVAGRDSTNRIGY